jgi:hypothetical protein
VLESGVTALVPSADFDFSHFKAGDVLTIDMRRGEFDLFVGSLSSWCRSRNITFAIEARQGSNEARIYLGDNDESSSLTPHLPKDDGRVGPD